jgi:hypothetical protein
MIATILSYFLSFIRLFTLEDPWCARLNEWHLFPDDVYSRGSLVRQQFHFPAVSAKHPLSNKKRCQDMANLDEKEKRIGVRANTHRRGKRKIWWKMTLDQ